MSSFIKSFNFDYLNNQTKDLLFSDDEDNDFNFKYVSTSQFQHIVKDVRRQRTKWDEERVWASFVQQQNVEQLDYHLNHPHNRKLHEQELHRLDGILSQQPDDRMVGSKTVRLEKSRINVRHRIDVNPVSTPPSPLYEAEEYEQDDLFLNLPIEKDEISNSSSFERSPISKLGLKSKSTTSHYAPTSRHGSERSVFRQINNVRCDTSPESSVHDLIEDYDLSQLRLHPAVARKILLIQKKISDCLDEMYHRLSRIPQPDGDVELKRRQQSVMEFSVRFSRNYLYHLGRQMAEIQKRVQAISPKSHGPETKRRVIVHMRTLEHKLCSTHQLLLNALTSYCKHISKTILKGYPGKLKEILQIVVDLKNVCLKINLTDEGSGAGDTAPPPLGNDTEKRCYAILSRLRSNSDNESLQHSRSTQSLVTRVSSIDTKKQINRRDNRKIVPSRLSMYTVDSRVNKPKPRRPVRLHPQDRSSSTGKLALKNPPPTPEQPISTQSSAKPKKDPVKRCRRRTRCYQKEDDIKTMMDIIPVVSDTRKNIEIHPETLTMETFLAALREYIQNNNDKTTIHPSDERSTDQAIINRKFSDGPSASESPQLTSGDLKNHVLSSHTEKSSETSYPDDLQQIKTRDKRPTELRVSEESAKRLLDYRDEYQSSCSLNPMYASISSNRPWEVVTWIADKLVDELIVDVSNDLEMVDVMRKLVEMEFQDC